MTRLAGMLDRIGGGLILVAACAAVLLTLFVCLSAAMRYLFGSPRLGGFVIGGVGALREEYVEGSTSSPYVNLGLGALVGITLATVVLAEPLTAAIVIAGALVAAGILLVNRGAHRAN